MPLDLDRTRAATALDTELTALCLEKRPQLFALAGVDHDTDDGGLIGWILAWPDHIIVCWEGRRDVSVHRSFADFWRIAGRHERSHDVRIIPLDGQPAPELE